MIFHHYQGEVGRRVRTGQGESQASAEVIDQMRTGFLGDRLIQISVGSAPTSPAVKQFISDCFGVEVRDGYGSTEIGSVTVNDRIARPPVIEYRLRERSRVGLPHD